MSLSGEALGATSDLQIQTRTRELESRRRRGAGWFQWVAGLSVVNSLITMFGGGISFVVGLAVTQVVDGLFMSRGGETPEPGPLPVLALLVDILVAGGLALVGYFAGRGHVSAFVVGMVLYALDGLVFLLFGDLMPVAFHGLAFWYMWRGLSAHRELQKLATPAPAPVPAGGVAS